MKNYDFIQSINANDGRRVVDLKLVDSNNWDLNLFENLCELESYEAIKKIRWPQFPMNEKFCGWEIKQVFFQSKVATWST